ncbi:MAG: ribonuclease P protein component [Gammaproteobacteria bacterium]
MLVSSSSRRFSRHQRLTQGGEFKRVFARARRSSDEYFVVLGQNNRREVARLGLAIPRKYVKSAVGRNRIKRLVRESFRQHQHAIAGLDLVVTLRGNATVLGNQEIFRRLQTHWQDIKRKCDAS